MSVIWDQNMERETDERYQQWKRDYDVDQQSMTIDSFDEHPLTLPLDGSWQVYRRDYPKPCESNALVGLVNVCKFYAACAAIFGAVWLVVKAIR